MNSHTRTAFQNPQQPMHSRSINHGGTSELQYRKELDAVAHNNALNVQICQAVANSHQNFIQPPTQPPKFQAVLHKVVQNGTSVEMGRSSARPGGNGVPTLPLGPPAVNLHVTQQQKSHSGASIPFRSSTISTEPPTQPSYNPQKPNSQQVASNEPRKRSLGDMSDSAAQQQDTQPKKARSHSPHGLISPFPTLPIQEQEELDSLNNAFSVVGEFCLTALSGVEDSEKREITQAWNVLQQHFLSYEWHLREKGDRDRRRMGLAGLVQSTQAQLENIKGLMTLL